MQNDKADFFKAIEDLWAETEGDPQIRIAVLDGPVDMGHTCFKGAGLKQVETLVSASAAAGGSASAHGTHIASILFGQPESPVRGIAPACTGLILPVFSDGSGDFPISCSQTDLARAITRAAQEGAHIINISGGQITPSGQAETFLRDAVKYCAGKNILIIAAAGNDGCDCLHVPAVLPSVLAVGAADRQGVPFEFSNWGAEYRASGILAPGEKIVGAALNGESALKSGTSFATPLVSGAAALLLSLQLKQGEMPDPLGVREIILETGIDCPPEQGADCNRFLRGLLNVDAARKRISAQAFEKGRIAMADEIPKDEKEMPDPLEAGNKENRLSDIDTAPEPVPLQVCAAPESVPAPTSQPVAAHIAPSEASSGSLVYALGLLGYDFGSDARRDFFAKEMQSPDNGCTGQKTDAVPEDPQAMLTFLKKNKDCTADLIWTLNMDGTPIYAVEPNGAFAASAYDKITAFFEYQINYKIGDKPAPEYTRVAVPGKIAANVTLKSGLAVPQINPALMGLKQVPCQDSSQPAGGSTLQNDIMFRLFYELRNLGLTPADRAKNAMNVYEIGGIVAQMQKESQTQAIESVQAEKCPVCRPNSDCWDVVLTTFDPLHVMEKAKIVYRVTMDVADVIPVEIGELQQWAAY